MIKILKKKIKNIKANLSKALSELSLKPTRENNTKMLALYT